MHFSREKTCPPPCTIQEEREENTNTRAHKSNSLMQLSFQILCQFGVRKIKIDNKCIYIALRCPQNDSRRFTDEKMVFRLTYGTKGCRQSLTTDTNHCVTKYLLGN